MTTTEPGVRVIDGEAFYSAAWLDADAEPVKDCACWNSGAAYCDTCRDLAEGRATC